MPVTVYSDAENKRIVSLRDAGHTWQQIADALGRGTSGAACRLKYLKLLEPPPAPPPGCRVRDCMTCRRPFTSEGSHNRMCDKCREIDVSPFEPETGHGTSSRQNHAMMPVDDEFRRVAAPAMLRTSGLLSDEIIPTPASGRRR